VVIKGAAVVDTSIFLKQQKTILNVLLVIFISPQSGSTSTNTTKYNKTEIRKNNKKKKSVFLYIYDSINRS